MTALELRETRAKKWEGAKAFLDSRRQENGTLSAEDDAAYEKMEQEIIDLGKEIDRTERKEAMDREMAKATSSPLVDRPEKMALKDEKKGRASDMYKEAFWNRIRAREMSPELRNALQEGTDSEGGYIVPDEFERTLVQALNLENVIRAHSKVITTSNGVHKIPVVSSHGSASWIEEEGAYTESDEVFGQVSLDAHKVGTMIKVSDELLADSAFDLEAYISSEFGRRIGEKEEQAFLVGDGSHKPTGMLHDTYGGQVGVTTAKALEITADEVINLYYTLKAPYRKNAIWVLNDDTIKVIRKLKDGQGQYLWQPALRDGEVSTILGRPYVTSQYAPTIAANAKTIIFGDLSYYWIGDRQGINFKRLNELYAGNGQVGFMASKRLDGKVVLPEAIKIMKQHA